MAFTKNYRITVRRSSSSLGYLEGMSVTVMLSVTESPLRGTGYDKVRRMFMAQHGIDIDQRQGWTPTYPAMFDIREI